MQYLREKTHDGCIFFRNSTSFMCFPANEGMCLFVTSSGGVAGAGSVMETPPSVAMAQRSPATSATPSTPAVSLHAGDSSTDTTLSTVGCVYFADTFLLSGLCRKLLFLLRPMHSITSSHLNQQFIFSHTLV